MIMGALMVGPGGQSGRVLAQTANTPTASKPLLVVELFTSQGCNSCPPADRFLGILAKRPGVLALSFHVDYWNYLGWKDSFSAAWATARQKAYRWALQERMIYTPQIIVDGRFAAVGSRDAAVERLIKAARDHQRPRLALTLVRDGASVRLTVPASSAVDQASLFLVYFDRQKRVSIAAGENADKTITYHHVVRDLRRLKPYDGQSRSLILSAKDSKGRLRDGLAVLAQRGVNGAIVGAAVLMRP